MIDKSNITIEGLDRVRDALFRLQHSWDGPLHRALARKFAWWALDEARSATHVRTGYLRASHAVLEKTGMFSKDAVFVITPQTWVINPLGDRPAVYGLVEEQRGGSHEFYGRAVARTIGTASYLADEVIDSRLGG